MRMKTFLLLGRNGDVINMLPLMQREAEREGRPAQFIIAKEFAGLLDGCSYIEPVPWPYSWKDARCAFNCFNGDPTCGDVVNCTIHARDYHSRRQARNFERQAWLNARADVPWGSLPLVFDRRSPAREKTLLKSLRIGKEPLLLCSFSGTSGPFDQGEKVMAALTAAFPQHRILDLSDVRAERLYDLLGVLERAQALVCTDSALLHLAAAVPALPVCSLIPDHPMPKGAWCRAEWTSQQIFRCLHSQALARLDQLIETLRRPEIVPRLVHVYTWFDSGPVNPETVRRMAVARRSWDFEARTGRWQTLNVTPELLTRDATSVGDVRLPFMRDMIELAALRCRPQDVLVVTNADTGFSPGITGWILDAVRDHGSCYAHRWDFRRIDEPPVCEAATGLGKLYPGSDLHAFSLDWWIQHGHEYPDMICGREAVDLCLRQLIKRTRGAQLNRAIWHEWHDSPWSRDPMKLSGNVHNVELAKKYLAMFGGVWDDWKISYPVSG